MNEDEFTTVTTTDINSIINLNIPYYYDAVMNTVKTGSDLIYDSQELATLRSEIGYIKDENTELKKRLASLSTQVLTLLGKLQMYELKPKTEK